MASLLELSVGTGKWDAGLKKAQQALNNFTQAQGGFQKALEKDNGDMQKFIQMMGKMDSTANTSKGQMNDYRRVLEQLTAQYNSMSEAMRKSDMGQQYARTIDSLKQKYQVAAAENQKFNESLKATSEQGNQTKGVMGQLADKFTVNIDAIKIFNAALQAGKAALGVVKDAFFASEQNVDAWGRTMEASSAVYQGFLNALNTGDISGYLSRIDDIVKAAKEAYNALDTLSTFSTIQAPADAKTEAEIVRLQSMLRQGRYIAPTDGRKSAFGLNAGDKLTPEATAAYKRSLEKMLAKRRSSTMTRIGYTEDAVDKLYNELADTSGISREQFKHTIANWGNYLPVFNQIQNYHAWNEQNVPSHMRAAAAAGGAQGQQLMNAWIEKNNPYANISRKWRVFKDSGDFFKRAQDLAVQSAQLSQQLYSQDAAAYRTFNKADKVIGGGGGGGGGGSTYNPHTRDLSIMAMQGLGYGNIGGLFGYNGINAGTPAEGMINAIGQRANAVRNGMAMPWLQPMTFSNDQGYKQSEDYKKYKREEAWDDFKDISDNMSKMTSSMSQLVSGVQQLGVKVPSGITKMLTMLQGITTILTAIETMQQVGTLLGLFNKGGVVRAAAGYQVPGNYGYDAVPSLLTSGEVVLNRAQTAGLARRLQSQGESNGTPTARISGEQIYIALTNYMNRRGYGETLISR